MERKAIVGDVISVNDCSGKKYISVTIVEGDPNSPYEFVLNPGYMSYHDKLRLATVEPEDEIIILPDPSSFDIKQSGFYLENLTAKYDRDTVCECGTALVSNGFDIHCPNPYCALTLHTQLLRLSMTDFYSCYNGINVTVFAYDDREYIFKDIVNPKFWKGNFFDLKHILLSESKSSHISLSTFLIEDTFRDFIDNYANPFYCDTYNFKKIKSFYTDMSELIFKRDYTSDFQNGLIREFLWSLGIESLTPYLIDSLIDHEQYLGMTDNVFIPYAYLLTHPKEMTQELGCTIFESTSIAREVKRRAYEFYDIFSAYSSDQEMDEIFTDIM